jgi:polyisoprenoid-binding protein YceI
MLRAIALSTALLLCACSSGSDGVSAEVPENWSLVAGDSRISFASIKAGEVIETHYFPELSGGIDAGGEAVLEIDLNAVETKVDIRNERMREMFFETATYPTATLTAAIDPSEYADLAIGDRRPGTVSGTLSLHGQNAEIEAPVFVTRIAADRISVESAEPVVVFVDDYGLGEGLEMLREVAGLDAITAQSPVTFTLVFEGA